MKINLQHGKIDGEINLIPMNHTIKRKNIDSEGNTIDHKNFLIKDHNFIKKFEQKEEDIIDLIKNTDEDIDFNNIGREIKQTTNIIIDKNSKPVFDYIKYDLLQKGEKKKEIIHVDQESTIHGDIPLRVIDKFMTKKDAYMNFLFTKNYYIVHNSGVTYKFLYDLAKELSERNEFAVIQAYSSDKKKTHIILNKNGTKYSIGLLEGKIDGDKYLLILHLSNQEFISKETLEKREKKE